MVLTRNQRKEIVIKLYEEGKTTREIAKLERMSLRDIGIILKSTIKNQSQNNIDQIGPELLKCLLREKILLKF